MYLLKLIKAQEVHFLYFCGHNNIANILSTKPEYILYSRLVCYRRSATVYAVGAVAQLTAIRLVSCRSGARSALIAGRAQCR